MKLNEEKLTAMIEAVSKSIDWYSHDIYYHSIRTALTPFCMEMTDEEIALKSSYSDPPLHYRFGFIDGAKFIRDQK